MFKIPVSIADNPKINQWLSMVEKEMRLNLAMLLARAVDGIAKFSKGSIQTDQYLEWVDGYQAQLVVLASQVTWSTGVECALQTLQGQSSPGEMVPLQGVLKTIEGTLNVLADCVLHEQPPVRRKKLEHLVSRGGGETRECLFLVEKSSVCVCVLGEGVVHTDMQSHIHQHT